MITAASEYPLNTYCFFFVFMPIPRESEIASYLLNQLGVIWSCLDTFAETEDIQFLYYLYLNGN